VAVIHVLNRPCTQCDLCADNRQWNSPSCQPLRRKRQLSRTGNICLEMNKNENMIHKRRYRSGIDKRRGTVFEIEAGRVDIGASIQFLSQYPGEAEYLMQPLCCLEVSMPQTHQHPNILHIGHWHAMQCVHGMCLNKSSTMSSSQTVQRPSLPSRLNTGIYRFCHCMTGHNGLKFNHIHLFSPGYGSSTDRRKLLRRGGNREAFLFTGASY
jgi:hypothetical protein